MTRQIYAQIEHHGPPKNCHIESSVIFGNNGLIVIRRGDFPAVFLSGNRRELTEQLTKVIENLKGRTQ
jgi:hypothetical protein